MSIYLGIEYKRGTSKQPCPWFISRRFSFQDKKAGKTKQLMENGKHITILVNPYNILHYSVKVYINIW